MPHGYFAAAFRQTDPTITHTRTLNEINKGFELMHAGESIRSVVVPRRLTIGCQPSLA